MTGNEMNTLMQDVAAWEALERAAGHDPDALDYPEDVGERIERMREENVLGHRARKTSLCWVDGVWAWLVMWGLTV